MQYFSYVESFFHILSKYNIVRLYVTLIKSTEKLPLASKLFVTYLFVHHFI